MSLKSFFRKKHKYETQTDLQNMTAEQIINLNPSEVGFNREDETGGFPLIGVKRRAMYRLLAIKRQEKITPNPVARQSAINQFLQNEGIRENPEVTRLLVNTNSQMMSDKVSQKQLENRFRRLRDEPKVPYTQEEEMYLRMQRLGTGGKRKRYSRRRLREKTKRKIRRNKRKTHRR